MDPKLLATYDKLGVPLHERARLAGVAVDAMNEWAKKFAPGLTFKLETLAWDGVYVKLMTDLAAKNPAHCISVESPIAYQLMADLLLETPPEQAHARLHALAQRHARALGITVISNIVDKRTGRPVASSRATLDLGFPVHLIGWATNSIDTSRDAS